MNKTYTFNPEKYFISDITKKNETYVMNSTNNLNITLGQYTSTVQKQPITAPLVNYQIDKPNAIYQSKQLKVMNIHELYDSGLVDKV